MVEREAATAGEARQPEAAAAATPAIGGPAHGSDPAMYANQLRANPGAREQILTQLHQTSGNAFVQRVLAAMQPRRAIPAAGAGGGRELPAMARARMEAAFDADLSAVRVHEGTAAGEADAQAYAHGTDIHFAPGRFDPASPAGLELLGHEVAHVVQQSEGRVQATAQHKSAGAMNDDAGLEQEADAAGARAATGKPATAAATPALSTAAPIVQRKAAVTPVAAARKTKLELLGDGTPAHKGLAVDALETYVRKQADWFAEPSLTSGDRDGVWRIVNLFQLGAHVGSSLANVHVGELLVPHPPGIVSAYLDGFDPTADQVQLAEPAKTVARVLELGAAMKELATFVPGPVLRHVVPSDGLDFLISAKKIGELQRYYTLFKPTIEKPDEWSPIQDLLTETITANTALLGWVSELHIFAPGLRTTLRANVANRSKTKPVLLVLMSTVDWNAAFLQQTEIEGNIANGMNLGLVVQGRTLGAVTAQVKRVAADYGKGGKIGQVVLAGHGSDTTQEMASDHDDKTAAWDPSASYVYYDKQTGLDSKTDPKKNGTEALVDTILESLDPATANIVFAGCLINSHDVDPKTANLSGKAADVQKQLAANVKAHPNLADYVRARMVATGHKADLVAANASTIFDTFKVDKATGRAVMQDPKDPAIVGKKIDYLKTGHEPEGVMRAALECCADPAIGIAQVSTEMRARATALATSVNLQETCIRVAFQLALPASATGTIDVAKVADIVHRIRPWGELDTAVTPAQWLADNVLKAEAKPLFEGMLKCGLGDSLDATIHLAWMKYDPSHATEMLARLTASAMSVEDFKPILARGIVDGHLASMLPASAATPTAGQLLLALTIAEDTARPLPAAVRDFLRAAAGGAAARKFPLAVSARIDQQLPNGEPRILELIGLTDKVETGTPKGNVDLDNDGTNEEHVTPQPHKAQVGTDNLMVRATATSAAAELGKLAKDTIVAVSGTVRHGTWSMIDFNGKAGFVKTEFLKR